MFNTFCFLFIRAFLLCLHGLTVGHYCSSFTSFFAVVFITLILLIVLIHTHRVFISIIKVTLFDSITDCTYGRFIGECSACSKLVRLVAHLNMPSDHLKWLKRMTAISNIAYQPN